MKDKKRSEMLILHHQEKPTVTWVQWTDSTGFQLGKLTSACQENKIFNSEELRYLEKIEKGDF